MALRGGLFSIFEISHPSWLGESLSVGSEMVVSASWLCAAVSFVFQNLTAKLAGESLSMGLEMVVSASCLCAVRYEHIT